MKERNLLKETLLHQLKFSFTNESTQLLPNTNETLLLIMHRDGYYYVTCLNTSKQKNNEIYLIPDNQVQYAEANSITKS